MERIAVLLCAGHAARMGFNKLTQPLAGKTAIERSMEALIAGGAEKLVFTVNEGTKQVVEALICAVEHTVVMGGATRGASVRAGLEAAASLTANPRETAVAIHDAARCFVRPETVKACFETAERLGSGIAAVPVVDTVFRKDGESVTLVPRDGLWRMQTPQTFRLADILDAYRKGNVTATDDVSIWKEAGHEPVFVPSDDGNFKLTAQSDWLRATKILTRYGTGFDTHRLVEGRKLILGGADIPFEKGLLGHSDADVLAHAVMDALLGAAALPDIGHLFPDKDPAFEGADSMDLMRRAVKLLNEKGFRPAQIDATIIAQRPKMAPYIDAMRENIAKVCGIGTDMVGIKATTTEGMNDEGKGLCISASAVATVI